MKMTGSKAGGSKNNPSWIRSSPVASKARSTGKVTKPKARASVPGIVNKKRGVY